MIWLDAHLSPRLASWISDVLGEEAKALRDIGLRDAEDSEIFEKGSQEGVVILTKDSDFADRVNRLGSPPAVIWQRCGNKTEEKLKLLLTKHLEAALTYIREGSHLVEIR